MADTWLSRWPTAVRDYSVRCDAIEAEAGQETLRRYRIFSVVVVVLNIAYASVFWLDNAKADAAEAPWVYAIAWIHSVTAAAMLLTGVLIHRYCQRQNPSRIEGIALEITFCAVSLFFGISLSLADQLHIPNTTNFSTVCLLLGMASLVRPRRALALFASAYIAFHFLAPMTQLDSATLSVVRSHALGGSIVSIVASVVVWDQFMKSVLLRRELAQANLTLSEHQEELAYLATRDSLTGLYLRREFMRLANMELARAKRAGGATSMVMVDIDHFKRINDGYGHPAGDAVLRQVATILGEHLRSTDILARMGGEEFVTLLPLTDAQGAIEVAEKLRRGLSVRPLQAGEQPLPVTASFGVSTSNAAQNLDYEHLYDAADHALYRAKQGGRNRVEHDQDDPARGSPR